MFTSIQSKPAINLIIGSLGAGKTTLIKNLLELKPENENWGVLVNEFGAIGIDGAILNNEHSSIHVAEIPGGCICCTALSGFQDAIEDLIAHYTLDRIFIEPTGLGEPDSMAALLQTPYFQQHFRIDTTFAVLDSAITKIEQFSQLKIMQNLVEVADVIVLNKTDRAEPENTSIIREFCNNLFPAKQAILETNHAQIEIKHLQLANRNETALKTTLVNPNVMTKPENESHQPTTSDDNEHTINLNTNNQSTDHPFPSHLRGLVTRQSQHQLNTISIGWVFQSNITFNWKKLKQLFQGLSDRSVSETSPLRAKGIFKVGEPHMLFQWVQHGEVTREYSAYCRDSRLEILLPEENDFDLTGFEKNLQDCQQ